MAKIFLTSLCLLVAVFAFLLFTIRCPKDSAARCPQADLRSKPLINNLRRPSQLLNNQHFRPQIPQYVLLTRSQYKRHSPPQSKEK